MKSILRAALLLAPVLLSLGCATFGGRLSDPRCAPACPPDYSCFGYYQTNWHVWPEECAPGSNDATDLSVESEEEESEPIHEEAEAEAKVRSASTGLRR